MVRYPPVEEHAHRTITWAPIIAVVSAVKAARRLPRSVKTVPLRALLDAYAEWFHVDGVHVHARPAW